MTTTDSGDNVAGDAVPGVVDDGSVNARTPPCDMLADEMPCPFCGLIDADEIVYGLPDQELMEQAYRGEVVLGGCCISQSSPRWQCRVCGETFGRLEPQGGEE